MIESPKKHLWKSWRSSSSPPNLISHTHNPILSHLNPSSIADHLLWPSPSSILYLQWITHIFFNLPNTNSPLVFAQDSSRYSFPGNQFQPLRQPRLPEKQVDQQSS